MEGTKTTVKRKYKGPLVQYTHAHTGSESAFRNVCILTTDMC